MTTLVSEPRGVQRVEARASEGLAPGAPVGYLIPEFPGQTHVWMWREITHLREWGVDVRLFSTRPPPARDAARHAWAEGARRETVYLWDGSAGRAASAAAWALGRRPRELAACVAAAARLRTERGPGWRVALPLVAPACVLARELQRGGVRHVHVHSCASSAIVAMLAGRLAGVPYSLTLNANLEWWGGAMAEKFGRAAFVVSITEWLQRQVRAEHPELGRERAILGRIGVDTRRWRPAERAARAQGAWRLATVGRLHASKGHDVLLRAVARLAGVGRDVRLTVIGSGPERNALETLAGELGIAERVEFAGSCSEERIIEELSRADAFVLASHAEPLGVVYMEAMALGVPTVGTAAGGVGEIITDGEDGLLVRPGDSGALALALERLMMDRGLRERLGRAGRETIVRRFDSRIGAGTLYERLFGRRPPVDVGEDGAAGVGVGRGAAAPVHG